MEFFTKITPMSLINSLHNTSVLIGIVALFIAIIAYCISKDNGLPPGPIGVPILGYWPFIRNDICHFQFIEMKKKYGEIFSFRSTGRLYITLSSYKTLREAHITRSDNFQERIRDHSVMNQMFKHGVVDSKGEKWETVRKYFLEQFKERGMTVYRENTAEAMYENIVSVVQELKRDVGKPIDILQVLIPKVNNVFRQTIFGPDTPITESEYRTYQANYREAMYMVSSSNFLLSGKIAKYFIMPFLPNFNKGLQAHHRVKIFLEKLVEGHKRTFDEDNIRDIIDSYLNERNIRRSKGDLTAEHFSDETLVANLLQFIGDGIVNGSAFITVIMKALLDHPHEQEEIYNELLEVCGDRNPGFEDRSKLSYTNAFLQEAQRTAHFIQIFPSLECTSETTIGGYRIPKGAITLINYPAIHNDPQVFENPEKFDPSRYLLKDGKQKSESPVTFGVGKRMCLGESFILMQTFLFITTIVKNFRLSYYQSKSSYEIIQSRVLEICLTSRE